MRIIGFQPNWWPKAERRSKLSNIEKRKAEKYFELAEYINQLSPGGVNIHPLIDLSNRQFTPQSNGLAFLIERLAEKFPDSWEEELQKIENQIASFESSGDYQELVTAASKMTWYLQTVIADYFQDWIGEERLLILSSETEEASEGGSEKESMPTPSTSQTGQAIPERITNQDLEKPAKQKKMKGYLLYWKKLSLAIKFAKEFKKGGAKHQIKRTEEVFKNFNTSLEKFYDVGEISGWGIPGDPIDDVWSPNWYKKIYSCNITSLNTSSKFPKQSS